MRAVVQRVARAGVEIDGQCVASIGAGMLVLLAIHANDTGADAEFMARKISGLRIFSDPDGRMNLDIGAVDGSFLVVSQFTLYGNCRKGHRPSYVESADPAKAEALVEDVVARLKATGRPVETGRFQAMMNVELVNDGPVTLIVESPRKEIPAS